MATGDYCTLAELKSRIWPDGQTPDNTNDIMLQSMITGVSRVIDDMCGRRFWTTTADETRYFSAQDGEYLFPDIDIISVTTLATDLDGDRVYETTWDTEDYDLLPENASLDSIPYSHIQVSPLGEDAFPIGTKSVKIIGKFGWSSTPAAVREACIIQTMRIYKRRDAPFGMVSNPVGGDVRMLEKLDPDVQVMLYPYRRIR
jgi:hypothetical protein